MTWLRHLVFAAAYGALALAVALTLPLSVDGIDRHTALLFGLVIFVFGGLLHEFWTRQEAQERMARRLRRLSQQQEEMRASLARIEERLSITPAAKGALDSVVSEVRLLERLAGQLPATPRAPTRVEPPTEPVVPAPASVLSTDDPATPSRDPIPDLFAARPGARPLTARPPERSREDGAMLEQVREALRSDRVDVFLQPVVSLPQRKHRYYEVFSRIRAEDGNHILPDRYLPVAAEAGLIAAIDNMLLFRCVQLIRETEKRHQSVGFMCNISAATLNDTAFMSDFVQYMGQQPNLGSKLVFELAQDDLMQGGVFTTGFLDGLKRLGFRFSMDQVEKLDVDWEELARHDIRYVKLDAARLLDPDGRFANPKAVRDLKMKLDRNAIDLIVEKIETDQQLLELLDLFIDFGQGYLFGEPRLARKQPAQ